MTGPKNAVPRGLAGDQFTGTGHARPPLAIMLLIDRFLDSHAAWSVTRMGAGSWASR